MASRPRTVVCVKRVKKGMPEEEWDESMPLPGDIIEGVVPGEEEPEPLPEPPQPPPPRGRSELSSQLRHLNRRASGSVNVRVRRGEAVLDLQARVAPDPERGSKLQRRYTIRAARDDRHVAILDDLTLDQVTELQEMSRRVVNVDNARLHTKGVEYDWKKKVGTCLPDRHSTVVSSILFMPFPNERIVDSIIIRAMAWFSAVASSGVPLVFINIQTEHTLISDKDISSAIQTSWREMNRCRQPLPKTSMAMVRGIRLWFLPGVAELPMVLAMEPGETRFGMDIKRTEEGFICISSVSRGLAADRSGLMKMLSEATEAGQLVVISRLEGSVAIPSAVSSDGLIHCCDHSDIKYRLTTAINRMEDLHLHVMAWPSQKSSYPMAPVPSSASLFPPFGRSGSFC